MHLILGEQLSRPHYLLLASTVLLSRLTASKAAGLMVPGLQYFVPSIIKENYDNF